MSAKEFVVHKSFVKSLVHDGRSTNVDFLDFSSFTHKVNLAFDVVVVPTRWLFSCCCLLVRESNSEVEIFLSLSFV